MIRILFLSANPIDRDHLRIRQERNEIQRTLDSATEGKRFEVIPEFAVNAGELQELLFRHRPQIVHFSALPPLRMTAHSKSGICKQEK